MNNNDESYGRGKSAGGFFQRVGLVGFKIVIAVIVLIAVIIISSKKKLVSSDL